MSYHCWTTDGYGFCADEIKTTPEKLMKLAMDYPPVYQNILTHLLEKYPDGWNLDLLTMEDFDDLFGDYGEHGVAYVLYQIISINVTWCCNYDGDQYILYEPKYPWSVPDDEKDLKEEDVEQLFCYLIGRLTDEYIPIDYYSVENGG